MAREYRLDADDSKLNPHIGQKVEITGTVEESSSSGAAKPSTSVAASEPTLKVSSVKMVASSCP
jgi:hypothetical protein